ncbi:hypothetical protein N7495_007586 [Penicillium taxi]|uniref:uncharacterized protein n=1 Tax=Penicillium taxi TaxID=168475 RepID=UPI002545AA7E|nr:uncharacterized protein N7495_007586 [Penicillium taxi]KAJ5887545.1 hypothetical protein N7495_007586 [Penicillium taxi]
MSTLTRAFTRRNKRPEVSAPMPYHGEGHVRFNSGTIKRDNISGPVQLLSTTNMLAYNAPDLRSPIGSSASSLQSRDDDSISPRSLASSITTQDSSSPVEPNPLSAYFPKRSATVTSTVTSHPRSSTQSSSSMLFDNPQAPRRALSHTKKSHQDLARKRSQRRMSPPPLHSLNSPRSNSTTRFSHDMIQPEVHPFSKELEQVNEVAEEFGNLRGMTEEEQILFTRGLKKFTANEYLVEIEILYSNIFNDVRKGARIDTSSWL